MITAEMTFRRPATQDKMYSLETMDHGEKNPPRYLKIVANGIWAPQANNDESATGVSFRIKPPLSSP